MSKVVEREQRILAAARAGDCATLRQILEEFKERGLKQSAKRVEILIHRLEHK